MFYRWGSVSVSFFCSFYCGTQEEPFHMQCCLAGRRISVHVDTCLYMCISSFVLLLCRFCFPSLFSDMAKGPVSKGIKCLGVFATGRLRCKRSRDKAGLRVVLKRVCDSCTEQRCKATASAREPMLLVLGGDRQHGGQALHANLPECLRALVLLPLQHRMGDLPQRVSSI